MSMTTWKEDLLALLEHYPGLGERAALCRSLGVCKNTLKRWEKKARSEAPEDRAWMPRWRHRSQLRVCREMVEKKLSDNLSCGG